MDFSSCESSENEKTEFISETKFDIDQSESIIISNPFVFIVLDCFYYVAGEKITGEILLYLPEDYPSGSIIVSSRGLEEVQLYETSKHRDYIEEETSCVYEFDEKIKE